MTESQEEPRESVYRLYLCVFLSAVTLVTSFCFFLLYGFKWPLLAKIVLGGCALATLWSYWKLGKVLLNEETGSNG